MTHPNMLPGRPADGAGGPANGTGIDIRLVNISKTFAGEVQALRDVSLDVTEGEFFTLLGPSGSGKSTLLRIVAGLDRPDAGRVEIAGREMTRTPAYRRPTSTVFQSYALFPHLDVYHNIEFGLRTRGVPRDRRRDRVEQALRSVGLGDLGRRRIFELSGGEQQRVALARCIVTEPRVLLLDEPLGALDEKFRKEMQLELKRIQRVLGITFVFVTHVQEEALSMSDRIGVLNRGRLEQVGTAEEIYFRPRSRFVADFIGGANIISGRVIGQSAGEMVSVEVGANRFVIAAAGQELRAGDELTFCVRPEKVMLGPTAAQLPNHLEMRIVGEFFRGSSYLYVLKAESGVELRADVGAPCIGVDQIAGWFPNDAIPVDS